MQNLRTVEDLGDLQGKTVILRADLDAPVENGEVVNNYRIKRSTKTIEYLTKQGAKVVVVAHMGRPQSKDYEDELSLMPVRFELSKLLDTHIKFAHVHTSRNSIIFMEDGEVLLLENVRFNPGETSEDKEDRQELIAELVELGDYYVNDAFASYRPAASTIELAEAFGENAVIGMHYKEELERLSKLKENQEQPYVAVIGGAKLDTKIKVLKQIVTEADYVLLGGAMAYTFLQALGVSVGDSKVETAQVDTAKEIMTIAKEHKCELMLPVDHICAKKFQEDAEVIEVDTQQIPEGLIGMDIGEHTRGAYLEKLKNAKTILWNGPMGVFEWQNFSKGTESVGEYIALSAPDEAYKVAGGGDTVAAMDKLRINLRNFDHVSTGGGAMLTYLAGEDLPTLSPLQK